MARLASEPFCIPPTEFAKLTMDQIELILRGVEDKPDDKKGMSERDYHRQHALYNCWPEWLEEKIWRERHPDGNDK